MAATIGDRLLGTVAGQAGQRQLDRRWDPELKEKNDESQADRAAQADRSKPGAAGAVIGVLAEERLLRQVKACGSLV